jgi:hypothetical protein
VSRCSLLDATATRVDQTCVFRCFSVTEITGDLVESQAPETNLYKPENEKKTSRQVKGKGSKKSFHIILILRSRGKESEKKVLVLLPRVNSK